MNIKITMQLPIRIGLLHDILESVENDSDTEAVIYCEDDWLTITAEGSAE